MGWAGFTPSHLPPGFFLHCRCHGREGETSHPVLLVLGVCNGRVFSGGIFHASKCPQSWLKGLFNELNYPVQVLFHGSSALLFTLHSHYLRSCASSRDLQTSNWARPKAGKVTSFWGNVLLHPWSPYPQLTQNRFAGRREYIQMPRLFHEPFLILRSLWLLSSQRWGKAQSWLNWWFESYVNFF